MSKKLLFFILLIPILSGCAVHSKCRVVTQIDVTSNARHYRYDSHRKMEKFLYYLRSLETWGPAQLDELEGTEYRITLTFSDGSTKLYRQRNSRCLSINNDGWLKIKSENADKLPLLLEAIPPDG